MHVEDRGLGPFDVLSATLAQEVQFRRTVLPNLRATDTLFLTSDYGGYHRGATHEAYSFLLFDPRSLGDWDIERTAARRRYLGFTRRMAYKSLGDRLRQQALSGFLGAADRVEGVVASFLVRKGVGTLFLPGDASPELGELVLGWKPAVRERLLRIVAFASFLLAGLSAPGQDVFWYTDDDEIAPNTDRLQDATRLFANISSHFLGHSLRHFRMGTAQSDAGDLRLEDLLAIPDLVAGAFCDLISANARRGGQLSEPIVAPFPAEMPRKARQILGWHGDRSTHALRSLVYLLQPTPSGGVRWSRLHTHLLDSDGISSAPQP